jgi:hypothetical protein
LFYYKNERILYFTDAPITKGMEYKIVIKNKTTGKTVEGITPIVEDFDPAHNLQSMVMTGNKAFIRFTRAKHAVDYEIHVNFIYFEVDKKTNEVVKQDTIFKNTTSRIGEFLGNNDEVLGKQIITTFFEDIVKHIKPHNNVVRYIGSPKAGNNGSCIQVEIWAAGNSMIQYLISNQATSSFVHVNTLYTNLGAQPSDGMVFGFLSSRVRAARVLSTNPASQDSLIRGSKTGHLGFRPWTEYKPNP